MADAKDNPYEILGLAFEATDSEVKKAYRTLALKYHPDKDSSDHAATMFEKVTVAHRVLIDPVAKAAFDNVYRLKKAAELRDQKMNAEQRKAKEDLEGREQSAKRNKTDLMDAQKKLEMQVQRIRDENARLIFAEQQKLRQYVRENPPTPVTVPEVETGASLRISWKADDRSSNGGYTQENLVRLFTKFGKVDIVVSKKAGSAIASFARKEDAIFAKKHESGLPSNPFTKISLLDVDVGSESDSKAGTPPPQRTYTPSPAPPTATSHDDDEAHEQMVLLRMMQAQQRKAATQ